MSAPITAIDALQGLVVAVGGAASAVSTVLISAPASVPTLGFFDANGFESTMTGDGLALVDIANRTVSLGLASQALVFHDPTTYKDATYSDSGMNLSGGTYSIGVGSLDGYPYGINVVTPGTVEAVNVSSTQVYLTNAAGQVATLKGDSLLLVTASADTIELAVPDMALLLKPVGEVATSYGRSAATLYAADVNYIAVLDATTGLELSSVGGYTVDYKPTGISSTASFDLDAEGVTFKGFAGSADQYLASAGAGVCPVWKDIPAPPASPLMMFSYVFMGASSGSPVWADIGEARSFLVAPAVMLQGVDAGGLVIPLTLTAVSTLGFSWVASSAIASMYVSVYALA